jgi:hypothetical protein
VIWWRTRVLLFFRKTDFLLCLAIRNSSSRR